MWNEKDHTDRVLDALFEEYKQLSTSFDHHVGVSYSVPPVVLTIVTGFFFLSGATSSSLIGFGVALGAIFLLIWLGLIQSMVNHIGVRLVELEIRINRLIDANSEKVKEPLSFYRRFVGQGFEIVTGFRVYFVLLAVMVVTILIPASVKSWRTMTAWQFPAWLRIIFVAIPPLLMVIVLLTMRYVDQTALARINAIRNSETL